MTTLFKKDPNKFQISELKDKYMTLQEKTKIIGQLSILLETTNKALIEIEKIKPKDRDIQNPLDDKMYNLFISEYSDGSGFNLNLNRYWGNRDLVEVVKNELKRQSNYIESKLKELLK